MDHDVAQDDRRRPWAARLTSWGVSLLLHGAIVALLASLVVVATQEPEVEAVITLDVAGVAPEALHRAEGDGGGAAAAPTRADTTKTQTLEASAAALEAPALAATGFQADAASRPLEASAADPAVALLAELASQTAAPRTTGQGNSPLLEGTSPGFQDMIGGMRGGGLDVVFVFDATDSMEPTVREAKRRIQDVINLIVGLLTRDDNPPQNVRFGVVAFKDYGDEFGLRATDGIELTADFEKVRRYINTLVVGGGGDRPEPLDRALSDATDKDMGWEKGRRNVVVLVTDAPVHVTGRSNVLDKAHDFTQRFGGVISVIDTGTDHEGILADLQRIAKAGDGEAFELNEADLFWRHLVLSIFGSRFEHDIQTIVDRYTRDRLP